MMRLKALRKLHKFKQLEIAEYLHIEQSTYSQYETELRQIPIYLIIPLAKLYNVSTDYILGLTEIEEPYPRF